MGTISFSAFFTSPGQEWGWRRKVRCNISTHTAHTSADSQVLGFNELTTGEQFVLGKDLWVLNHAIYFLNICLRVVLCMRSS